MCACWKQRGGRRACNLCTFSEQGACTPFPITSPPVTPAPADSHENRLALARRGRAGCLRDVGAPAAAQQAPVVMPRHLRQLVLAPHHCTCGAQIWLKKARTCGCVRACVCARVHVHTSSHSHSGGAEISAVRRPRTAADEKTEQATPRRFWRARVCRQVLGCMVPALVSRAASEPPPRARDLVCLHLAFVGVLTCVLFSRMGTVLFITTSHPLARPSHTSASSAQDL